MKEIIGLSVAVIVIPLAILTILFTSPLLIGLSLIALFVVVSAFVLTADKITVHKD